MIKSFADRRTAAVFAGRGVKGLNAHITRRARVKLQMLDAAHFLEDLAVPPGNRLEALKGNRAEQMSIRINDQWRICFRWRGGEAVDVEIVDYHRG